MTTHGHNLDADLYAHDQSQDSMRLMPLLYTESGSPRFCDFHPIFCDDSEADEAALIRVCRPHGKKTILVALTWSDRRKKHSMRTRLTEGNLKEPHSYHYGAPPPAMPAMGYELLVASGIQEIWVREYGVWLKLDSMLCASIPFLSKPMDDLLRGKE